MLLALLTAKVIILTSIGVPLTALNLAAFFWQDIATTAVTLAALMLVRPTWIASPIRRAVIGYVALSAPVTVVLGSPLTWTMIHAARGALYDSIRHHLTTHNMIAIGAVWAAGLTGPWLVGILTSRLRLATAGLLLAACGFGMWSAPRIDTVGLDRNALTTLLPRNRGVGVAALAAGNRLSPFPAPESSDTSDLASYRGVARGMNVLLIVLESTAAQYLKPYGAADDPMPTVTTFATHALIYDRAYAAYPESVKGLYATLCGRMPVPGMTAEEHASLPCDSIARSFDAARYRTALFHSGRFGYLGMAALLANQGFGRLEDAGSIGGQVESSFGVEETATVSRLLSWMDDADRTTPFFAAYLPAAGHHPYATIRQGPFGGDSDFVRYSNALHEADEAVAQLLRGLHDRGLDRDTVVMIIGDHGEAFGQHPGNAGHSLFIYDENVHVPWMIAIPGLQLNGKRVATVASLVDVPSTLRDLTGLPVSDTDQGQGLGRWPSPIALFFADYSLSLAGLRDGCWTYLYDAGADRSRLFDVCQDAAQAHDRSHDNPERASVYRQRVTAAVRGQSGNMVGQR